MGFLLVSACGAGMEPSDHCVKPGRFKQACMRRVSGQRETQDVRETFNDGNRLQRRQDEAYDGGQQPGSWLHTGCEKCPLWSLADVDAAQSQTETVTEDALGGVELSEF